MENGVLFNQLMISEGFGHEYTYNLPYKYQEEFKQAEHDAREEKRGLWAKTIAGDCSPEPASQGEAGFRATGSYECTRNTYKYQEEFKQAEHDAREEKRGLWAKTIAGDCSPEPASQGEAGFSATGSYEC